MYPVHKGKEAAPKEKNGSPIVRSFEIVAIIDIGRPLGDRIHTPGIGDVWSVACGTGAATGKEVREERFPISPRTDCAGDA